MCCIFTSVKETKRILSYTKRNLNNNNMKTQTQIILIALVLLCTILSFVLASIYNNIAFIGISGLSILIALKAVILFEIRNK